MQDNSELSRQNKESRLPWIDNCKALAICCVIFFHESQFWNWGGDVVMPVLHRFVASFIMPLFVMVSGYCGFKSLSKNTNIKNLWNYNLKNFKRIYLPSLSLSVILWMLHFEQFSTIKGILGANWFLAMLFALTLLASFIWIICSYVVSQSTLYLFLPLAFAVLIFIDPVHIGEMIPFYLVGMVLKYIDFVNRVLCKKWLVFLIVLFTTILFSVVEGNGLLKNTLGTFYRFNFLYFLKEGTLYFWLLRVFLSTSICISIIALFYNFSKTYNFFSWIGSQTLTLYLFSIIPMYVWESRQSSPMLLSNNLYNYICSHEITLYLANTFVFVLTVGCCLLLTYVLNKSRITRFLFLGRE